MNYSTTMIDKNVYKFMGSCFYKLKTSDSWRGRKDVSCTFTKEEKEALNAMLFFILLIKEKEEKGRNVNFDACIAYVIKRLVRKALTWDAKPENMDDIKRRLPNYDREVEDYVNGKFLNGTNSEFFEYINLLESQTTMYEREIFSVAKNHTNLVEFKQIKNVIFQEDAEKIERRLCDDAERHKTNQYVSMRLETLISRLSWARNIVRWQGYGTILPCNILCHMLETGVFAWIMANEINAIEGEEKYSPSQAFLVGLFHDVSEIWTDDIPSPCKDEIGKAHGEDFRKITEDQEREALKNYFYVTFKEPKVSEYFKKNIMLDELEDEDFHKFMKKADYFSADYEIWWNIVSGLRHYRFPQILKDSANPAKRTPAIVELLKDWIYSLEGYIDFAEMDRYFSAKKDDDDVRAYNAYIRFKQMFIENVYTFLKP